MSQTTPPALSTMRRIRDARDIGSADNGRLVTLNLRMEDGSNEWFAMHHAKLARFVTAVMAGGTVAMNARAAAVGQGVPIEEASTLIGLVRINAASAPGADHVALRIVIGDGLNLDFRVPLEVVPALQDKLAQALAAARGDDPPAAPAQAGRTNSEPPR
jgi:hypothetical protein